MLSVKATLTLQASIGKAPTISNQAGLIASALDGPMERHAYSLYLCMDGLL